MEFACFQYLAKGWRGAGVQQEELVVIRLQFPTIGPSFQTSRDSSQARMASLWVFFHGLDGSIQIIGSRFDSKVLTMPRDGSKGRILGSVHRLEHAGVLFVPFG